MKSIGVATKKEVEDHLVEVLHYRKYTYWAHLDILAMPRKVKIKKISRFDTKQS